MDGTLLIERAKTHVAVEGILSRSVGRRRVDVMVALSNISLEIGERFGMM